MELFVGGTCLVQHINKRLCVISNEGMDRVILILTRGDRVHQGGEFIGGKRVSDQTLAGWSIEVEKAGVVSNPCDVWNAGPMAYHSWV